MKPGVKIRYLTQPSHPFICSVELSKDNVSLKEAHKSSLTASFCLFQCVSEFLSESAIGDECLDSTVGIPGHFYPRERNEERGEKKNFFEHIFCNFDVFMSHGKCATYARATSELRTENVNEYAK